MISGGKLIYKFALRNDVQLSTLALQSAGLTPPDLLSIVQISKQKAVQRLVKLAKEQGVTFSDMVLSSRGSLRFLLMILKMQLVRLDENTVIALALHVSLMFPGQMLVVWKVSRRRFWIQLKCL